MMHIDNLHATVEASGANILKGLNLDVKPGEIHAIMGPNGSGKSTLVKTIAGHPSYTVTSGSISFNGLDLLELEPSERALAGIFLAFQYPIEIPGVNNSTFLRTAYNAKMKHLGKDTLDPLEFEDFIYERLKVVDMDPKYLDRSVNYGFSGGEKKRNEILQMAVLEPKLALLDETDSGLDIDALRTVAQGVNALANDENSIVLVTHYQRLLNYIEPDTVHVMVNGKIVRSGDKSLALELEEQGYDHIIRQAHESIA